MKLVSYGDTYRIYGNDLETHDKLPAGTYKIDFNMMSGFSLEKIDNFEAIEDKIYGNHEEKIAKVLRSFSTVNRSLGVILSGNKGMGKSLFVQLLGKAAIEADMPVIMVPRAYKGVADFIESIDQEVLVLFDEFEKVFTMDGEKGESQNDLLGLFDGTSQKKRLYAITVNHLRHVSEYMVSRPGRFHYHIRFDYPTHAEIEVYLKDKLQEQYYSEIKHVISFASRVKLNYDSLRAIAFEINQGYTFGSAIADLNILATDEQLYNVKIVLTDGKVLDLKRKNLHLFSDSIELAEYIDGKYFAIKFDTSKIQTDMGDMFVDGEDVHVQTHDSDGDEMDVIQVKAIMIKHHNDIGVNYKLPY